MSSPRTMSTLIALPLAAALGLAACASGPDPGVMDPNHMYAHFNQVGEIQAALVAGDVDGTRAPARWLATHRESEFPAAGDEALEMMRTEARVIQGQENLLEVGRSVGRLGVACGACHEALDGGPTVRIEQAPASSRNGASHMQRHAWAVERLWEGLFAPSDAAWAAGAGALAGMPLDFGANDQANQLGKRVHALSAQAREAHTAKDRAEVYGQLMETCALCHGVLGLRLR